MLLNYDHLNNLYIIGTGVSAHELYAWISKETSGNVFLIPKDEYNNLPANSQCIIGFQNIKYRNNFLETIRSDTVWPSYIHPCSDVTDLNSISIGTTVAPFTAIGYGVRIGSFASISSHCDIGHGSELGNNCVLSPGIVIGGSTIIEDNVYFGMSTIVKDKISITSDTQFAMSSVVTKCIKDSGVYIGNKKTTINLF